MNEILKKLYQTNFFDLVSVKISNQILVIRVTENPIIQNINYEGIKSSQLLDELKKDIISNQDHLIMKFCWIKIKTNKKFLKNKGYYFSR